MTILEIRRYIEEALKVLTEEDSAFATTDISSIGSGSTDGVSTDASYMYRTKIGSVQKRHNTKSKPKRLRDY